MAGTTKGWRVTASASEIWDRAEAMLEVTGDRVLTDELEDLTDR
jgi:hypothetical protein